MSRSRSNIVWILPLVLLVLYVPAAVGLGFLPLPRLAALEALRAAPPSPDLQSLAQTVYLLVVSGLGLFIFTRLGWLVGGVFFATAAALDFAACRWLAVAAPTTLAVACGLGLVWTAAVLGVGVTAWQARARLRAIFAGRLAETAIREILRDPDLARLESETRPMSGLCCRLIVPEGCDAASTRAEFVCAALTRLTAVAIRGGGMIDAISAGGFTAFWNAPLNDPDHAAHACEAAVAMQKTLAGLNEVLAERCREAKVPFLPLDVAIGVATGPATAGRIDTDRPTYSASGLMLEIAVRLQQIADRYGAEVLTSAATQAVAGSAFAFLEVDHRQMEPNGPVRLYALQGNPAVRASPRFRALATFHTHLFAAIKSQQWKKARELIARCRTLSGASARLYDLHAARIAYYERNPPGADWDGAYRPPMH